MSKNVINNYAYNLLYEVFLLIVPIAVTPYVARVLGEVGSGQYSYTYSLATYFTLIASLGFTYYAQRLIASHQGDKCQQTIDFWEVVIARCVPAVITLIIYFLLLSFGIYDTKYSVLMLVLSINIFAVPFDISFFFQGNEEFGKIVLRNIVIKSASILCIFLFVKDKTDLGLYALIQSGTILLSNISLWVYIPKYLVRISIRTLHPLKHIVPTIRLFLPTIATSVYTSLDKTLIGIITKNDAENGNYEYAEKLIKMVLTILTSLGTVMSPRNSKKFADGDIEGVERNISATSNFVFFLGVPLMFGIIAVADNLIPWYLGVGYNKAANIMKILAPIVLIIGLSNVFGRQFLIPSNQDKKFTTAIVAGAGANFTLNIFLIPEFGSYGAAAATVFAELTVTCVMLIFVRKNIKINVLIRNSWKYWLSGVIMLMLCGMLGNILAPSILNTLLIVLMGGLIYLISVIILKDKFVYDLMEYLFKRWKKTDV